MKPLMLRMLMSLPICSTAESRAAEPTLVRIVVLDTSTSMAGDRLEQAIAELREMLRQLPPTERLPVVVIPFEGHVREVRKFTDLKSCEAYLARLSAGGGTRIAAGLQRCLAELKSYPNARHVCVLLYTDGQDRDLKGIMEQEEQLDRLFVDRSKRGLGQTVVFCKRWEGANADLVAKIKERGHVPVVDAGDLRLSPVTLMPSLSVSQTRWAKDALNVLEIEVVVKVDVRGANGKTQLSPMRLTCLTPNVVGDVNKQIIPGQPNPTSLAIRLPVSPELRAAGGRTELAFQISQPRTVKDKDSLVLPTLAADQLRLPVDVPRVRLHSHITVTLAQPEMPYWTEPLTRKAAFPLKLSFKVENLTSEPWTEPVHFNITPGPANRIIAGDKTFVLKGPGDLSVTLTVDATAATDLAPGTSGPCKTELTITPAYLPANVTFEPPQLQLVRDLPAPPPVTTTVTARTRAVATPQWIDLVQGLAAVEAEIEFRVDGPLTPGTSVTVQCPPSVRQIRLTPARLRPGVQTVKFVMLAILPAAPARKSLVFSIIPPSPQGAVRFDAPDPVEIIVTGPAPLQLVLTEGERIPSAFDVVLPDDATSASIRVVPTILSLKKAGAARGLMAVATSADPIDLEGPPRIPLFTPTKLPIRPAHTVRRSFFSDTFVQGELAVLPSPASDAVRGSKHPLLLRIEAPFKRLLFYLAASLSAILAAFFLFRLYVRLRTVDSPTLVPEVTHEEENASQS